MFDLFRRRDTFVRYVLIGLLSLVAISMVVTLIPGFGTGGGTSGSNETIAEVGGEPITYREAAMRVDQSLRGMGQSRGAGYSVATTTVDNLIAQRSAEYLARKMGFTITDDQLVEAIKIIFPQAFPNGQFVGKDAYAALLGQRGMSVPEFESRVRTQMLISRVGNLVDEGIVITPADIEAEYKRQNDKLKIEYVALRRADAEKQISVTEAEVRAEYDKNKANYKVPEKRSAAIFYVDEAKTAAGLQPNEADLRRSYDEQKDRFRTPERLHVRHILLKTTGKPDAEVTKLQAKAEDLLKQLKGGANFGELAKVNSEDPGSAVKGGDLGFIVRGQTVKNFEEAAWSLKPNELSNVVKTEYGFHILQLLNREEARLRPFEEVKGELAAETQRQVVFDRMQRNIDGLRAELLKNQENLEQKAQQFGAVLVRTGSIAGTDAELPEIGKNPELTAQIAGLKKGDVTSVVQAGMNKLAIAVLAGVEPERPAAFEDVAADIRKQIAARKLADLMRTKSNELAGRAKAPGADLKKLAAEVKGEYKTPAEFNRNGAAEGLGSAALLADAFGKSAGYVPNPIGMNGDLFVVRVIQVVPADLNQLAQNRESIVSQLKQQRARERGDLFQDGLVQRLTKEGKVKIYQENLQRLLNSYRSS